MEPSAIDLVDLANRMENRAPRAFSVSPATAPIVIAALRQMASAMMKCDGLFKVERWDARGLHVQEVLASASNVLIARGAFAAAIEMHPRAHLTLRQGIRIISKSPEE
jgi:hypothetical protein